ncbi:MAG TPA: family 1 glycosylhydrolase [Oscillatoriaceae cyanobacterium]
MTRWIHGITRTALAALLLAGCSHAPSLPLQQMQSASVSAESVPSGFLWGVSTAGYQWEGGDRTSQWAAWDAAGKTPERNSQGADGWNRYAEDAQLTHGLGCNAFRTSIEWARIEPQEGVIDQAAVQHYHQELDALQAQGLTPVITLMHFAYPAWLDKEGGWENPRTATLFAKYAAFVAHEFGAQVHIYLTFNEPNVFLMGGWLGGGMPPGKTNPIAGLAAMHTMVQAHALAYDAIHRVEPDAKVSFNMYTADWTLGEAPATTPEARAGQQLTSDTAFADQAMGTAFLQGKRGHTNSSKLDFACFDYYCKFHLRLPFALPRQDTWEVDPQGLYKALVRYHNRYGLPVLVAENGMATWNHQARADHWTRSAYIVAHVQQLQRAIAAGVPVLGYFQWSITDNYEWGSFSPCFGLFSVDCRDQNFTRVPADGAAAYRAVIGAGGVTPAIAAEYPPPHAAAL